jgi:hypothetical protein
MYLHQVYYWKNNNLREYAIKRLPALYRLPVVTFLCSFFSLFSLVLGMFAGFYIYLIMKVEAAFI